MKRTVDLQAYWILDSCEYSLQLSSIKLLSTSYVWNTTVCSLNLKFYIGHY